MQKPRSGGDGPPRAIWREEKEQVAVIYGEPEAAKFLEALKRLKQLQLRKERQAKQARRKVRAALRKSRA